MDLMVYTSVHSGPVLNSTEQEAEIDLRLSLGSDYGTYCTNIERFGLDLQLCLCLFMCSAFVSTYVDGQ
jgi:hypothetical protein